MVFDIIIPSQQRWTHNHDISQATGGWLSDVTLQAFKNMDVKYENNKDHEMVKLDGKNLFQLSSLPKFI